MAVRRVVRVDKRTGVVEGAGGEEVGVYFCAEFRGKGS